MCPPLSLWQGEIFKKKKGKKTFRNSSARCAARLERESGRAFTLYVPLFLGWIERENKGVDVDSFYLDLLWKQIEVEKTGGGAGVLLALGPAATLKVRPRPDSRPERRVDLAESLQLGTDDVAHFVAILAKAHPKVP